MATSPFLFLSTTNRINTTRFSTMFEVMVTEAKIRKEINGMKRDKGKEGRESKISAKF
jgi:hypothetical protein